MTRLEGLMEEVYKLQKDTLNLKDDQKKLAENMKLKILDMVDIANEEENYKSLMVNVVDIPILDFVVEVDQEELNEYIEGLILKDVISKVKRGCFLKPEEEEESLEEEKKLEEEVAEEEKKLEDEIRRICKENLNINYIENEEGLIESVVIKEGSKDIKLTKDVFKYQYLDLFE